MDVNERVSRFRTLLQRSGIDAALLVHPRDVFYYSGTMRPASLLVTAEDAVLFVRRGYDHARREATVAHVQLAGGFSVIGQALADAGLTGGKLGTELDVASVELVRRMAATLPDWSLADVSPLVLTQRSVKDQDEVETMRRAADIASSALRAVPGKLMKGVTELELAADVEQLLRLAGYDPLVPIRSQETGWGGVFVIGGSNLSNRGGYGWVVTGAGLGPAMPYGPSRRSFKPGDLVVVDAGVAVEGYCSDHARTFVVGKARDSQRALFAVACETEDAVLEQLRPGVTGEELYAAAEQVVKRGAGQHYAPGSLALPGFVGHGLGLEMDEPPVLDARQTLVVLPGMVLAVEIEVSAAGSGEMAKIEDTVLVRADGLEVLTRAPRELVECHIGSGGS